MAKVFFKSERAKKHWCINDVTASIEPVVRKYLLFLHAWNGCDTTSSVYGHGQASLLKKTKSSKDLQKFATTISDPWANQADVTEAGAGVFGVMYGGKRDDTLSTLRYK